MVLAAALAALAVAAPASTGLLDDVNATGVALAGPDVIVMRELPGGRTTQLTAVPRAGGKARTLLSVAHVQRAFEAKFRLAASDQRVAVVLEMLDEHDRTVEWRVYAGPPSGPLAIVKREPNVGDEPWVPELVGVDGSRVLVVEAHEEEDGGGRAEVIDAAGAETPIGWTTSAFVPIALAGPYAAAAGDSPQRLSVVDLANGAELSRVGLNPQPENVDIAADGRVAAASQSGLSVLRPGAAVQRLPKTAKFTSPRFAGTRLVALDARGGPVVVGGKVLGPPSRVVPGMDADAGGVAWVANGCVRY